MPANAAVSAAPAPPDSAAAQRRHNEGHGRRLTAAFEALEAFPALAESRNRLLRLVSAERVSPADIVATVESDIALVISVMRLISRCLKAIKRMTLTMTLYDGERHSIIRPAALSPKNAVIGVIAVTSAATDCCKPA